LYRVGGIVFFVKSCTRNGAEFEVGEQPILAIDDDVESFVLSRTRLSQPIP
jgi:hypothetical protein